jgi:hypothetical protein
MKNTNKNTLAPVTRVLGIAALMLAMVFTLSSCKEDDPPPDDPQEAFYGTWLCSDAQSGYGCDMTIKITEGKFELTDTVGDYIKFDIDKWTEVTTKTGTDSFPTTHDLLANYPSGYTLDVKAGTLAMKGYTYTFTIYAVYMHKDGKSIRKWSNDGLSIYDEEVFIKQ